MYDSELIIRSAALSALKELVNCILIWTGRITAAGVIAFRHSPVGEDGWLELSRTVIIPSLNDGLGHSTDLVKKGFLLLLSHLSRVFG